MLIIIVVVGAVVVIVVAVVLVVLNSITTIHAPLTLYEPGRHSPQLPEL